MSLRTLKSFLLAGCALVGAAAQAQTAAYPSHPITLIMPFPAGGPSDALGRAVANKLGGVLGTTIVVENVGGVGGSIGLQKLARAPADGYTIGFGGIGTHGANMIMYRKPLYDAVKDHEPLAQVGSAPMMLLVKKDLPVTDFKQFVDYVRSHRATMSYGSAGVGSISHLGCLLLLSSLGTDVMHVPYKGVAPAMTGLMGGETDFMCDQTTTAMGQIAGGRIKPVAMLTKDGFKGLPNVPTAQSSGLVQIDVRSWNALFAPKGTPPAIVQTLNAAINTALADKDLIRQMAEVGVEFPPAQNNTPADLARLVSGEIARLRPILEAKNVFID